MLRNTNNLHWALLQSINDTFRRASSQFEERLNAAIQATKAIIEATLERRRTRTVEVEPEIARIREQITALSASREEIIAELHIEGENAREATDGFSCAAAAPRDPVVERRA